MPQARIPDDVDVRSGEITPTQLFTVFAHERRQHALAYLSQRPAAVLLGDLAEYIAIAEEDLSQEWRERIRIDLYHSHLRLLSDLGLARLDPETDLVSLTVDRDVLVPYLDLSGRVDG